MRILYYISTCQKTCQKNVLKNMLKKRVIYIFLNMLFFKMFKKFEKVVLDLKNWKKLGKMR